MNIEKITFDFAKYALEQRVDLKKYLNNMKFKTAFDNFIAPDMLDICLESTFLKKPAKSITVLLWDDTPRSWWQMLKRDICPNWLLKKFPVKKLRRVIAQREIKVDHLYAFAREFERPPDIKYCFTDFKADEEDIDIEEINKED